MSTDTERVVAQIAAEAEATRDDQMPGDAVATKPNKSVTVATGPLQRTSPRSRHWPTGWMFPSRR